MLIASSGLVQPGFHLLTLGVSSHYLLDPSVPDETEGVSDQLVLFDVGLTAHVPALVARLQQSGTSVGSIKKVLLTHLHPERIGGVPTLRKMNPDVRIFGSSPMQVRLTDRSFVRAIYDADRELSDAYPAARQSDPLDFDTYFNLMRLDFAFPESELMHLSEDIVVRCLAAPGHTPESVAYLIAPYNFLVVDECFGYFRGRNLAGPGGDSNLEQSLASMAKFKDVDVSALCFPNRGMISGHLVRRHLEQVAQNTADLVSEVKTALAAQVDPAEVKKSIEAAFYTAASEDPLLDVCFERTLESVWGQLCGSSSGQTADPQI